MPCPVLSAVSRGKRYPAHTNLTEPGVTRQVLCYPAGFPPPVVREADSLSLTQIHQPPPHWSGPASCGWLKRGPEDRARPAAPTMAVTRSISCFCFCTILPFPHTNFSSCPAFSVSLLPTSPPPLCPLVFVFLLSCPACFFLLPLLLPLSTINFVSLPPSFLTSWAHLSVCCLSFPLPDVPVFPSLFSPFFYLFFPSWPLCLSPPARFSVSLFICLFLLSLSHLGTLPAPSTLPSLSLSALALCCLPVIAYSWEKCE